MGGHPHVHDHCKPWAILVSLHLSHVRSLVFQSDHACNIPRSSPNPRQTYPSPPIRSTSIPSDISTSLSCAIPTQPGVGRKPASGFLRHQRHAPLARTERSSPPLALLSRLLARLKLSLRYREGPQMKGRRRSSAVTYAPPGPGTSQGGVISPCAPFIRLVSAGGFVADASFSLEGRANAFLRGRSRMSVVLTLTCGWSAAWRKSAGHLPFLAAVSARFWPPWSPRGYPTHGR